MSCAWTGEEYRGGQVGEREGKTQGKTDGSKAEAEQPIGAAESWLLAEELSVQLRLGTTGKRGSDPRAERRVITGSVPASGEAAQQGRWALYGVP